MKNTSLPWLPWYPAKWLGSNRVLVMTLAEQGLYRNLLDAAWMSGGSLPNNPVILAKRGGASSLQEFEALWPKVSQMFVTSEDGQHISNDTLRDELADSIEKARHITEERSAAGKRGAAKRWKDGKNGKRIAKNSTLQYISTSSHPSTSPDPNGSVVPSPVSASASPGVKTPAKKTTDPRFQPIKKAIETSHLLRLGIDPDWEGGESAQLSRWLKANPKINLDKCLQMVKHVYESVNDPGRPRTWISNLTSWAGGPKDKYGHVSSLGRVSPRIKTVSLTAADAELDRQLGTGWRGGAQ